MRGRRAAGRTGRSGAPHAQALVIFTRDTAGRGNWGHPGLAKLLKDVGVEESTWEPGGEAHSIWEEVNHIIYWSRFTLDCLEEGRNKRMTQAWPAGEGDEEGWRKAVAATSRLHAALVRRTASLERKALAVRLGRTRYTYEQLVLGCAAHISYHAGRIALLRRLYRHAHQPDA
jgi:uncharacterized damage-inducible protein DinB